MNETQAELSLADFQRYFPYTPAALCVKECAAAQRPLRRHACPPPILDVGCGDGLFAGVAFQDAEVWASISRSRRALGRLQPGVRAGVLADVTRAKLPEAFFRDLRRHCSLEHVPRIDLDHAKHLSARSNRAGAC